ncbi:hypothetical protein M440DRAFT_236813 [Trichoderma longibrachiatum ATCC 18648]|uniref:Uncharacterized protein n=1 Tax=Trichoderma longibrachiatum ATCC 18648 TaxID=983965 RepID=A0A2T4CCY2_TRILO|nr:hypothetical protein M440DRAFT_236813 [Trichoderma longibrachiatum ATCC 18648]
MSTCSKGGASTQLRPRRREKKASARCHASSSTDGSAMLVLDSTSCKFSLYTSTSLCDYVFSCAILYECSIRLRRGIVIILYTPVVRLLRCIEPCRSLVTSHQIPMIPPQQEYFRKWCKPKSQRKKRLRALQLQCCSAYIPPMSQSTMLPVYRHQLLFYMYTSHVITKRIASNETASPPISMYICTLKA